MGTVRFNLYIMKLFYLGLFLTVFCSVEARKKQCQTPAAGGVAMCELNIDSMGEEALAAINDNLPRCCAGYECTEIDNTGNKFCVESGKAKAKAGEACSIQEGISCEKGFRCNKKGTCVEKKPKANQGEPCGMEVGARCGRGLRCSKKMSVCVKRRGKKAGRG